LQTHYQQIATPFQEKFTKSNLELLLKRFRGLGPANYCWSTTEASLGPLRCGAGLGAFVQVTGWLGVGPSLASGSRLRRDERTLVAWCSGSSR
jgi:hypothetical protein